VNDQPTVYDDDNAEELAEKQLTGEFEVFSGLQYEIVEITTRGDGDKMHRHLHGNYGSRALSGLPHTGVEARNLHYDWKPTTSALIPYTPENIEALETIRGQFIALNKLLKDRFMPDKIDALLTEVTSSKLRLMYTP
jgi:hypothetical protein